MPGARSTRRSGHSPSDSASDSVSGHDADETGGVVVDQPRFSSGSRH